MVSEDQKRIKILCYGSPNLQHVISVCNGFPNGFGNLISRPTNLLMVFILSLNFNCSNPKIRISIS